MNHEQYTRMVTASTFDVVEADEVERTEKVGGNRALIAARTRVISKYAKYVGNAKTAAEVEERIDLVKPELLATVVEACSEHDFNTQEQVQQVLTSVVDGLRKIAGEYELVDMHDKATHDTGSKDEMQFEADVRNKDEAANPDSTDVFTGKGTRWVVKPVGWAERNSKTADLSGDQNAGDSSQGDSVDVAKDTYPTTDTKQVPEGGLPAIDVDSVVHPLERQPIDKVPSEGDLAKNPIDAARNDKTTDVVDADKPIGTEEVGPPTQTHPNGSQTVPVTSGVSAKWRVADGN